MKIVKLSSITIFMSLFCEFVDFRRFGITSNTAQLDFATLLEPCFSFLRLSAYWFAVMLCC